MATKKSAPAKDEKTAVTAEPAEEKKPAVKKPAAKKPAAK